MNFGLKIRDDNNTLLKKYFSDRSHFKEIDELYKERRYVKDIEKEFILDMLENEIVLLMHISSLNDEEKNILNNIKVYYGEKEHSGILLFNYISSPIFNDRETFKKIFGFLEKSVINNKKKRNKKIIRDIIERYLLEDSTGLKTSKYVMFEYLSSSYVDNEDIFLIEKVVRKILSKEDLDYYEVRFLLRYFNNKEGDKYNYQPCKLYMSNIVPFVESNGSLSFKSFFANKDIGGHAYGIVVINTDYINSKDDKVSIKKLPLLIEAVIHEGWHYKQLYDFYHSNITEEALAYFFDIAVYDERDRYKVDYPFLPLEYQANIHACEEMKTIYKEYFNKDEDKKYNYSKKKVKTVMSYGCSAFSKDEIPLIDKYLVRRLIKRVKNNPIIVASPFIKMFFHDDGSIKSFKELVESCSNSKYFNMFYPFFTYMIERDKNIDLDDINTIKIISMMAKNEALVINEMLKGYKYFSLFNERNLDESFNLNQNDIILERYRRFNTYISYIKNIEIKEKLTSLVDYRLLKKYIYLDKQKSLK